MDSHALLLGKTFLAPSPLARTMVHVQLVPHCFTISGVYAVMTGYQLLFWRLYLVIVCFISIGIVYSTVTFTSSAVLHIRYNNCYGVLGVLDRLHNTDEAFRKTKKYQRHFTFLNLTPLTKAIPESTDCKAGIKVPCDSPQD